MNRSGHSISVNEHTVPAGVHSLPPELLARIFELVVYSNAANSGPQKYSLRNSLLVSQICGDWRRLALDSPQLWRHVDIHYPAPVPGPIRQRLKRRMEHVAHAQNMQLGIYLTLHEASKLRDNNILSKLLAPYWPRIKTLSCHDSDPHASPLIHILSEWLQSASISTVSELYLYSDRAPTANGDIRRAIYPPSSDQFEELLSRIRYLTLYNVVIPWSSRAYHGLVELDLRFDGVVFVQISDFAAAIRACPQLRSLKLERFHLDPRRGPFGFDPVKLEYLEILFFQAIDTFTAHKMLPMLQPGAKPLYMKFGLPYFDPSFKPYLDFLKRCHVAKLLVKCRKNEQVPKALPTVLKHTEHLLLDGFTLNEDFFVGMNSDMVLCDNVQTPTVWPRLRTLHLLNCDFNRDLGSPRTRLVPPIPHRFMMFCSGCRFWAIDPDAGITIPLPVPYDSPMGQIVVRRIESYVPGFQGVPDFDSPFLSQAWALALDFQPKPVSP